MNKINSSKCGPEKDNTCAIITIFNPQLDIFENIKKIKNQVNHIILIINQCDQNTLTNLRKQLPKADNHHIIQNPKNMGLAYALNQGIESAYDLDLTWALLLDQDTTVDENIIHTLSNTIEYIPEESFLLGSNYRSKHNSLAAYKCKQKNCTFKKVSTIITSGSILNLITTKEIGTFNSDYFIDSIDHEYCLRARSLGFQIYITCEPVMTHDIGVQDTNWLNRIQCFLSHPHTPERKYYVIRNTIITANKYITKFPLWSLRQLLRVFADILSTILFENQKLLRLNHTVAGIKSGFRSEFKPGPLELLDD